MMLLKSGLVYAGQACSPVFYPDAAAGWNGAAGRRQEKCFQACPRVVRWTPDSMRHLPAHQRGAENPASCLTLVKRAWAAKAGPALQQRCLYVAEKSRGGDVRA